MAKHRGYYSIKELADLLKISRIAVYKKIRNGQLKAKKAGRNYVIEAKGISDLIDKKFTDQLRLEIENGVAKVIKEYGETLKLLGKE